ncbi:MAG: sel1 repeat family protein [Akkermansia sp.]|nr:sel1 repeat family protein [Akkermansia sp.]
MINETTSRKKKPTPCYPHLTPKARDAILQGIEYEQQGNYPKALVFYLISSRNGSREGRRSVRRMQKKLNLEHLTEEDLLASDLFAQMSKQSVEKPKVAPSMAMPKEDKKIMVKDFGYVLPEKEKVTHRAGTSEPTYTRSGKINQPDAVQKRHSLEDLLYFAKRGDLEFQLLTAQYYDKQGNKEEANKWYKIAAQKGHPDALYYYGMKYLSAARNYLEKAAKKNHAGARHELNKLNEAARNFNKKSVRYFVYYVVDNEQMNYPHCVKRVCNTVSSVVDDVWTYEWCECETEVEALPEKLFVVQPFLAWIDGVSGMEKTTDYTVQSGHGEETETVEFPCYEMREVDELAALAEQVEVKPWYVRVWQVIKRYFCKN